MVYSVETAAAVQKCYATTYTCCGAGTLTNSLEDLVFCSSSGVDMRIRGEYVCNIMPYIIQYTIHTILYHTANRHSERLSLVFEENQPSINTS